MTFFAAAALAAVTWYPAPDWVDRPDPVASVHARKAYYLGYCHNSFEVALSEGRKNTWYIEKYAY